MDVYTTQLASAIDYIHKIDFSCIADRMVKSEGWLRKKALIAIAQYKNFLILHKKYPNQKLVPSVDIDDVWHNHILFSKQYMQDCQVLFGGYFHHDPATESASRADQHQLMQQRYDQTQELYRQEFGEYILQVRGNRVIEKIQIVMERLAAKASYILTEFGWLNASTANRNNRFLSHKG